MTFKAVAGVLAKEVAIEFVIHSVDRVIRGEFETDTATTTTTLYNSGFWLKSNVVTESAVFQKNVTIGRKAGNEPISIEPAENEALGITFDPNVTAEEITSNLAAYLMYTDRLTPASDHLIRLTLHEHHPTFQFSVGPLVSQSKTWVEVEIIERTDTYDGIPVMTSLDVDVSGTTATGTVSILPPSTGITLEWSLVGTDGYTNNGSVTTNNGNATFSVPVGAGGVRDIATVKLPATLQTIRRSWIY